MTCSVGRSTRCREARPGSCAGWSTRPTGVCWNGRFPTRTDPVTSRGGAGASCPASGVARVPRAPSRGGGHARRGAAQGRVRVFSPVFEVSTWPKPGTATQRCSRMCARLGCSMHLHQLRHFTATELIAGGVDVRTVAGRLGYGGGGATTLRVYSAWVSEADQRASASLSARMPELPVGASLADGARHRATSPRRTGRGQREHEPVPHDRRRHPCSDPRRRPPARRSVPDDQGVSTTEVSVHGARS